MKTTKHPDSCLIIGAGISGLMAAGVLRQHGVAVTLLDKSHGVGGRMATRRVPVSPEGNAVATFDHGAQFFTARSAAFKNFVSELQQKGMVQEWFRGQPGDSENADEHPRFRGARGMTDVAKFLAQQFVVRLEEYVIHIRHDESCWHAMTAAGAEYSGDAIILTPPVPQSLALLQSGDVSLQPLDLAALKSISYEPCVCVMAVLDGPSRIPAPGALRLEGERVAWMADNYQKGISEYSGAVTIHANAGWSRAHYDESDDYLAQHLCDGAKQWLGPAVVSTQVRRWRYSKAVHIHSEPCLVARYPLPLFFAGDAFTTFGTANVESAALSGVAAARAVLKHNFAL